ncbi:CAP domain-containing protein [Corynebacterium aquilae]|uniref:SCP domain-containing protein n=1 Tax=Corynebacterium aquilae DSM 44791 TaxID=1431546 RepID=A0A1L7CE15_9CORY|nr:CAP domain-containing protein [Corynebacterium aquilae]APT84068.1 hypothetical protein CAQU_02135 [Corynebacterium aquilae DSM 44791]
MEMEDVVKKIHVAFIASTIATVMAATPAHAIGSSAAPILTHATAQAATAPYATQIRTVDGVGLNKDEADFIWILNEYRAAHGLSRLRVDQELTNSSRYWSEVLASQHHLHHSDFNVYENVLESPHYDMARYLYLWQQSPGHNANLLEPKVSRVGFGVRTARDGQNYATLQLL